MFLFFEFYIMESDDICNEIEEKIIVYCLKNQPYMKITVTNENNLTTDYTLTSNGIVGQP